MFWTFILTIVLFFIIPIGLVLNSITVLAFCCFHKLQWKWFIISLIVAICYLAWIMYMEGLFNKPFGG